VLDPCLEKRLHALVCSQIAALKDLDRPVEVPVELDAKDKGEVNESTDEALGGESVSFGAINATADHVPRARFPQRFQFAGKASLQVTEDSIDELGRLLLSEHLQLSVANDEHSVPMVAWRHER